MRGVLSVLIIAILGCTGAADSVPTPVPADPAPSDEAAPEEARRGDKEARKKGAQLPDYHGRFASDPRLAPEDVAFVPRKQLSILRNEIFARYGRPFTSDELKEHFRAQPWYEERADFDEKVLTANDRANIALIQRFEGKASPRGEYQGEGYTYTFTEDMVDVWHGDADDLYNWENDGGYAWEPRGDFVLVWDQGAKNPRKASEAWLLEVDHGEKRVEKRIELDPRRG